MKNYTLITSENINKIIDELNEYEYVSFDTESTGLNVRKDTCIGFSFSFNVNSGYYFALFSWNKIYKRLDKIGDYNQAVLLLNILRTKKLIMHNASFDIRLINNFFKINLLNSLYADTQLMKHTLNEEGPFALKENALQYAKYIGFSEQDVANQEQLDLQQNVISNGGVFNKSNKEIYKADLNILYPYACSDTDLTLRLFKLFNEMLKQENLYDLFYNVEVMPLYKLVTIRMESRGLHLNMPMLSQLKEELEIKLKEYEIKVIESLLKCEIFNEYINNRIDKEYEVSNKGSFAQQLCEHYNLSLPKLESGKFQLNKKTINLIDNINIKTFLQTGDSSHLDQDVIKEIKKCLYLKDNEGKVININSKQQLAEYVFEYLQIEPLSYTEKKDTPQFNEDFVESISSRFEWAKYLRIYNKLTKIYGSYYQRLFDEQEDGVWYPYFKQHGTTSGRYSSNAQQLPRPLEKDVVEEDIIRYFNDKIRELIIPKPGYLFIDDDYESLEPRCFCEDADEDSLKEIFFKNLDMYSVVAILVENLKDVSADKSSPNFLKKKYPQKRQESKEYSLGVRYGLKAFKLSKSLNISEEEAQAKIDSYFKAFPKLKSKMELYFTQAKTEGKVYCVLGRVRHLPQIKELYNRFGDDLLDFKKLPLLSKKTRVPLQDLKAYRKIYNNLLNNALNFPIQALATSIVNRAAIAMTKKFIEQKLDAWVSAQVHDEIVVTCAIKDVDIVSKIMQDCMENTTKLSVPLVAIPTVAKNLKEGK